MSLPRPRVLLLDLDGTLADSLGVMKTVYRQFMESRNLTPTDAEFEQLNGPPIAECIRILKDTHQIIATHTDLMARYQALIDRVYGAVLPYPDARALLEGAIARGCKIGIVTSNTMARTQDWLARTTLESLVDAVVASDKIERGKRVTRGKPAPDPYIAALAHFKCEPKAARAVEDSPLGATSARAARIPTFALGRDMEKKEGWPEGVTFVASLADVLKRLESED